MQPPGTPAGSAHPSDGGRRRRRARASASAAALLLAATGLLAACGTSAPSPGLPGGAVTNVLEGGVTGAPVAPVRPAPPDFAGRAAVVADAVRRAGVPTAPAVPVLLSGWALDLGFDTDEQKIAWNARKVDLAPGVPTHTTGTVTGPLTRGRATGPCARTPMPPAAATASRPSPAGSWSPGRCAAMRRSGRARVRCGSPSGG